MNRVSPWRWVLVAVWGTWLFAIQGFLAAHTWLDAWTPNLGLVLMLTLLGRVARAELYKVALALFFARAAVSIEPPVAILAVHLFVVALAYSLRGVIEISRPMPRSLLAGVNAFLFAAWFELVHRVRDARDAAAAAVEVARGEGLIEALAVGWPCALSTALLALVAGPLFARLPGLTPLWKTRSWHAAASLR